MATKVVFITSSGAYTIPSDFGSLVSVEAIGSGGYTGISNNMSGGGGGGAYAKSTGVTGLVANGTAYAQVSSSSTSPSDSWFNASSNAAPSSSSQGVLAKAGGNSTTNSTSGLAGSAASSIGTVTYSGGPG